MPSFFLAETCKYLYLLFDDDNFAHSSHYMFTTEGTRPTDLNPLMLCAHLGLCRSIGHLFPIDYEMQRRFGDTSKYVYEKKTKTKTPPPPVK
jgi:hypothetical protein